MPRTKNANEWNSTDFCVRGQNLFLVETMQSQMLANSDKMHDMIREH